MPFRTCVICRGKGEKHTLVRFARNAEEPGSVVLDLEERCPGRGAYCHFAPECLGAPKLLNELRLHLSRSSKAARVRDRSSGRTAAEGRIEELAASAVAKLRELPASNKRSDRIAKLEGVLDAIRNRDLRKREPGKSELQKGSGARGKKVRFPL